MSRILILMLLLQPLGAFAEGEKGAKDWLANMNNALSGLSYAGRFVFHQADTLQGMYISHQFADGKLKARLVSLNGSPREVNSEGKVISIIRHHKGKVIVVRKTESERSSPLIAISPDLLEDNYEFKVDGRARVAGLPGIVVLITPKDSLRYGYRLVLEKHSALPLDVRISNEKNELVSQLMFTELRLSNEQHTRVESEEPVPKDKTPVDRQPVDSGDWSFDSPPPGYRLQSYRIKDTGESQKKVEHFVFSDGLATISIYAEPARDGKGLNGATRLGSVNAVGQTVDEHQLTAVGEVPLPALEMMLASIRKSHD